MQTKSDHSIQSAHQDTSHELSLPLFNLNEDGNHWLSHQLNRVPYKIFRFWLVLTFPLALIMEGALISAIWNTIMEKDRDLRDFTIRFEAVPLGIGFMFLFYGSAEMLFALKNKKSRVAQQGFLRFQYGVVGSIVDLVFTLKNAKSDSFYVTFTGEDWVVLLTLGLIPVINLIGGYCVLRIFEKYQILTRQILNVANQEEQGDFAKQNEAISSEIYEYNEKLNSLPHLFYKLWLKFVVLFEITRICEYIVAKLIGTQQKTHSLIEIIGFSGLAILSLLSAYSSLKVDVAIRTKALIKLNQAIPFLKICTGLSIVLYLFAARELTMNQSISKPGEFFSYIFWSLYCMVIPIFTLFGALQVRKILEQRDQFVKVSSYNDEVHL